MFFRNDVRTTRQWPREPLYELDSGPPPPVSSFDSVPRWVREVFAMNRCRTVYLYAVYLAWMAVHVLSRYDPALMPLTEPLLLVGGPPGSGKTIQKDEFCYRSGIVPFHLDPSTFEGYRAGEPVERCKTVLTQARDLWLDEGKMSLVIVDGLGRAVSMKEGYINGTTHTQQIVSTILEYCDYARQQEPQYPVPPLLFFANDVNYVDRAIYRGGRCVYIEWDITGRDCLPAAERMFNGSVDRDSLGEIAEAHPEWRLADFAQIRSHLMREKVFERYQNTSLDELNQHLSRAWDQPASAPDGRSFDHDSLTNAVRCVEQEKAGKARLGGGNEG